MLRAIVFDFDGVIVDSEPLHFRGFRDVLTRRRVELVEQDYYARYLGYDDVGVFQTLAADRGLAWTTDEIARLVSEKAVILERLEAEESILFPGAAAAIRRAAAAVPLAIASGALGPEIRRVLDREGLTPCFAAIVAAEDTPVSKPSPDPYLRAVDLLRSTIGGSLLPADCVAIEDSPWGLQSARAAGLRTVGVARTYVQGTLDADIVIASIDELDVARMQQLCGV